MPLVTSVDVWLCAKLPPDEIACCLIYGSVARGADTQDSDLDTLLITKTELPQDASDALKIAYGHFQTLSGFVPDPAYPLEIRSIQRCYAELASIDSPTASGADLVEGFLADAAELLRALTGERMIVRNDGSLEGLARLAAAIRPRTGYSL